MMAAPARNPLTMWEDYERGVSPSSTGRARAGSTSSFGDRSVQFDEQSMHGDIEAMGDMSGREGMRQRNRGASISRQLAAVANIGGVNSIRSFTKSWSRAAGFQEVLPQRPAFVFAPDQAPIKPPTEGIQYGRVAGLIPDRQPQTSLLSHSLLHHTFVPPSSSPGTGSSRTITAAEGATETDALLSPRSPLNPLHPHHTTSHPSTTDFRERERKALEGELGAELSYQPPSYGTSPTGTGSLFAIPPHLASPPVGSFSSLKSYGTVGTTTSRASMIAAGPLWRQQQEAEGDALGDEPAPIFVREVEQDGKMVLAVEGQSTLPQTVFNSINVLIGVGLLSLPMGLKYSGWVIGLFTLAVTTLVTAYTAKLLAKCMDKDVSLITFSDVAYISFGSKARLATSVLFTLELMAACVALLVLFADSLDLLFPGVLTLTQWKVVCAILLIPLNFLPLSLLSFTSVLGIISCASIVVIVLVDGFFKQTAPGSLIEPAKTYLWPDNWLTLPLSFGILMSPWGGHSVFPNIYRDMRHPQKYGKALKYTYSFTFLLDATTAVAGILMFGDDVHDEVTSSILTTVGYPKTLTFLMCLFIGIIPLTKIPLNARPIVSTIEVLTGLHTPPVAKTADDMAPRVMWQRNAAKVGVRVGTIVVFLVMSILFPAFDVIMAFMGSALCFSICVVLPVAFYLKLYGNEISNGERILCWILMVVASILCIVGTVWAFLPKHLIGAD